MIIVACGPTSSSAAKSTAYDTDIVELLVRSGSWTLSAAVAEDSTRRTPNRTGWSNRASGKQVATTAAPATMTAVTYNRATPDSGFVNGPVGRWRSNAHPSPPSAATRALDRRTRHDGEPSGAESLPGRRRA